MLEELKREIISNIKILLNLKDSIKRYYNKDVEIYEVNEEEINNIKDEEKLKEILDKQVEDIGRLNVIMEVEGQNFTFEYQNKCDIILIRQSLTTIVQEINHGIRTESGNI